MVVAPCGPARPSLPWLVLRRIGASKYFPGMSEHIPFVQVRSKSLVVYEVPAERTLHTRHKIKAKGYSGEVTEHARRRIMRTVDVFLQKSETRRVWNPVCQAFVNFRLSFITLTIPWSKPIEGAAGHDALRMWLQHFRRKPSKKAISEQLSSYVWKAELQERGQLHYHITANRFLHWAEIQRVWNGLMDKRGWLEEFRAAHGHSNPNSTDVHSVYKVRDIQAYLGKYLSKTGASDVSECGFQVPIFRPSIGAKVWGCSEDLKCPRFSEMLDSETDEALRAAVSGGGGRLKKLDFCDIVEVRDPAALLSDDLRKRYETWRR